MADNYYIDRRYNKHRIYGLTGTLLIHGILLVLFLFFAIQAPNPPWESEGMMMSLGDENMGGPSEVPIENPQPNEQYTPIEEQTVPTEEITSDDPESAAINEKPVTENKKPEVVKPTDKPVTPQLALPKKVNQQALFQRKNSNQGDGGRGDGDIPGNEGRPDGDPNGDPNGTGTGDEGTGTGSDGIKFDLKGRQVKQLPKIEDNSRATGKVVVRIVVDRDGNVIQAVPGQVGSTTTDPSLLSKAKEGALRTKFSVKDDAPEQQFGYMTVYFRYQP